MKLTATTVQKLALPKGKSELIVFDDEVPGFGLRLRDGGSRGWIFQYKIGAKQRRIALGAVKAIDHGKARDTAKDLYAKVRLGQDPAGQKAEAKATAHHTFKAVADEFLAFKKKSLRDRSYPDVERHLVGNPKLPGGVCHAKPLHELQIRRISLRDIATCLNAVEKNSGDVTRNRVRTTLSTFFSWAIGQGYVTANPVISTTRAEETTRDRVLSPAELRTIWKALPADQFGAIMKLLALTGQRAGEIAGLRWTEIQDDLISLPGERTKNHRPHTVPLSPVAQAIITAQPQRTTTDGKPRDLIFGNGEGPFSGWSKAKDELDAAINKANGKALAHWTPHDLRRSLATHSAEMGIAPHIIEAALNHVSGHKAGVAGIYNRAAYEPEKRTALNRWAEQLIAWVEGKETNVTPLRRKV
jgi:integrase